MSFTCEAVDPIYVYFQLDVNKKIDQCLKQGYIIRSSSSRFHSHNTVF